MSYQFLNGHLSEKAAMIHTSKLSPRELNRFSLEYLVKYGYQLPYIIAKSMLLHEMTAKFTF